MKLAVKEQIIADNMKAYVEDQLEENRYRRCQFGFPFEGEASCHFLADPGCTFYGHYHEIPQIPQRKDFYTCNLRKVKL